MNQDLARLQPYPFERLRTLFAGVTPPAHLKPINLSIGEPKHPTPQFIKDALLANFGGLSTYPTSAGSDAFRQAIANWLIARHKLPALDFASQVLPVNGSREALFSFAQIVLDRTRSGMVICPNPFYQIYEGAALLGGARPSFINAGGNGAIDYAAVPADVLAKTQLVYVCSPGNPTGRVMTQAEWTTLFDLSAKYGFVIASDECYSEIYCGSEPPLGALQAALACGNDRFERLMVFSSLPNAAMCPACDPALSPAMPRSSRHFCCTAPTTAAP